MVTARICSATVSPLPSMEEKPRRVTSTAICTTTISTSHTVTHTSAAASRLYFQDLPNGRSSMCSSVGSSSNATSSCNSSATDVGGQWKPPDSPPPPPLPMTSPPSSPKNKVMFELVFQIYISVKVFQPVQCFSQSVSASSVFQPVRCFSQFGVSVSVSAS